MSELKTNPNAEVTMIKEVGGCSVILQFKNYKDFLDYQRLEGELTVKTMPNRRWRNRKAGPKFK